MTLAFLPLLRRSRGGRIVNISSTLGSSTLVSDRGHGYSSRVYLGYGLSKAALNAFTIQMANWLKDTPIKINSACPGYCATDLTGNSSSRTAAQGAVTPAKLALLPEDGPFGGFFEDAGIAPWQRGSDPATARIRLSRPCPNRVRTTGQRNKALHLEEARR